MSGVEGYGLTVTDGAVSKIKSVLETEERPSLLRLSVQGGGCAGFKYEFTTESISDVVAGGSGQMSAYDGFDDEDMDDEEDEEDEEDIDEVSGGSDLVLSDNAGVPILLIDRYSKKFLENSTIDYVEDMNGSRFVVSNPSVRFGCGCGNSFSL
ncbi:HesB/IscA family protein [Candidatus Anaplasma sp. TIGMIC]|uniref:HesB/IscA family protein n=1 Tax=Candidatus Anaplasma sp. TIGMIC TaxID=3020713 RepID=UPI00232D1629|nr:iron-sulfur cluster biosynthesis family protein [Candidatus Anaplasma sp. TIGMIC]MDB1135600.1 iron-sulfur cluster biosynthesis family protein [Candidatus Anaplasma sp. TIGMIC]